MNIAYVRVSTVDQNEDRQIEALKNHKIEKYFVEKASAKDTNRREFQKMMEFAREGDTIYVEDFSRMARSVSDLLRIVEEQGHKAGVIKRESEYIYSDRKTDAYDDRSY